MSFIRKLIEKKISSVTGATVMFGEFKFSPMSGTIEIIGAKVAAERFVPPFLSIERIEVQVVVARALRGEIVIKNLVIDRPVFIYQVHSDGKTNQPQRSTKPVEAIVAKEKTAGGSWELNAEKIAVNHGRFEYRDATRDNYKLTVEGINASVTPQDKDLVVTMTADSVGRRDREVEVGTVKLLGKLSGGGLSEPLASSLSSRISIADSVVADVTSSFVANGSFDLQFAGAIPLATLVGLIPLSRALTWSMQGQGSVGLRGNMQVDLLKSIHVTNLELKAGEFSLQRTFGAHSPSRVKQAVSAS